MGAETAKAEAQAASGALRYRAFISYSHKDDVFVAKLHHALEAYRMPGHLRRKGHSARLTPIFRDVAELRADGDLSAQVKQALADSEALIVVASPHARASPWVAREIELFREGFPDRPVLVALVSGEPDEAFPQALYTGVHGPVEPLAADFRPGGDGDRLARLKLIATLADVPLDALVQRDASRRMRLVMAVTALALISMVVLAALLMMAMRARAEAERQREEAEGMVEFMLTDLRDRLRAVGRIDVMSAVNKRAMQHYSHQDLSALDDDSLDRRARLITAMGEDDEAAGNLDLAETRYNEVARITGALLAKAPNDPERIFSYATSINRLALMATTRDRKHEALEGFRKAAALLDRLPDIDVEQWLRLHAIVTGNICAILLKSDEHGEPPLRYCNAAVAHSRQLAKIAPGNPQSRYDLGFHLLWLAKAYDKENQPEKAARARQAALAESDALVASDPNNMDWREQNMQICTSIGRHQLESGDRHSARRLIGRARKEADYLLTRDAANAVWRDSERKIEVLERELGQ